MLQSVEWSRAQFALTAIYHWLFVPLTLGLSVLCALMETRYYRTGDPFWRSTTKFWMRLFGINFAIGVATGLILEFEFGTNWSNYSNFVGDIFGAPLAIEGIMAFFLESTFVAVMFFGWDKVSRGFHLSATWLTAIGANLSALWILVANSWMQYPVGCSFNIATVRNEMDSFWDVLFSPVAINKFSHTVTSSFLLAAIFVMGVSAWYLLRGRHRRMARSSIALASVFGLVFALVAAFSLGCDRGARAADEAGGHGGALQRRGGGAADGGGPAAPRRAAHLRRRRLLLQDRHPQAPLADEFPLGQRLRAGDQRSGLRQRGAGHPLHGRENVARTPCDRPAGPLSRSARKGRRSRDARGRTAFRRLDARRGGLPARLLRLLRLRLSPLAPGDGAQRAAGLLFVPRHGRCRLFLHPALCRRVVAQPPRPARRQTLAAAGDDPVDPAGLPRLAGWIVAEVGRQPWTIQNLLPACVSGSHIAATPVAVTFFIFLALFTVLLAAELAIMLRQIKIGPNE